MTVGWRSAAPHAAIGLIIVAWVSTAWFAPDLYDVLSQEDRVVEWATTLLFAAAGVVRLRAAWRERRFSDALVGLFCLFVAGEEISWGQRVFGYTPINWFLDHNTQQEASLHNFADRIGRPKWTLSVVLGAYGLLMPMAARVPWTARLMARIGATPPPADLVPWFAAAISLLVWYPFEFTGEWMELVAGTLFLAAVLRGKTFVLTAAGALAGAVVIATAGAYRTASPEAMACARAELDALVLDITQSAGATSLLESSSVHKRLQTAARSGYLDPDELRRFRAAACPLPRSAERRRYGIDPWGTAYWIELREVENGEKQVGVYSFGPNRRRDEGAVSDDVKATLVVSPSP